MGVSKIDNVNIVAVQNKEQIDKIIKRINKNSYGNILYLNCLCTFVIGGKVITNKLFDKYFYSEDSNLGILFSNQQIQEDYLIMKLDKNNIKYTVVNFIEMKSIEKEDESFPQICFAKGEEILKKAVLDSINKGSNSCVYYPDMESKLILGYKTDLKTKIDIESRISKGVLIFSDKVILLTKRNNEFNIGLELVEKILKSKMVNYKIKREMRGR